MRFFGIGTSSRRHQRHHRAFYRRDPDRVAGGYKAALSNPKTTRAGRKRAEAELHAMGRSAHVPLMTKIKRALGMHKTPRRQREESRRERQDYSRPTKRRQRRREREYVAREY
ncbi:hypothetical protein C8F04DRAFT_1247356 [Mycena alexandri]|uniref:Uncharacterized protein n=1 Tax=Mycena alexandri TaxID=1745969 RepID=A0AAD6XCW2_9AGAR|nr:hypothetical protein C8F04DRAFT_1247356 [Mycena alexandri]